MAPMFRVMSAQCPTVPTGTISRQVETIIRSLVLLVIVQETIQAVPIIMEQVTPSIQDREEASTITTVVARGPMYPSALCGKG